MNHACAHAMRIDRALERSEIYAVARVRSDLHRAQPQRFDRLQAGIEARRLDRHRVAGLRDRLQRQVQRLERAVRDDDLIREHADAQT